MNPLQQTTAVLCAAIGLCVLPAAYAKLPAPTPEAQAKAEEAKAKAAWSGKVAAFQLCQSMDRVATRYAQQAKAAGKDVKPATPTPACSDPGPYQVAAAPPPLEAAGAHSPAKTATAPPSGTATAAEQAGTAPKK